MAQALPCPRCRLALLSVAPVFVCAACGGVFVPGRAQTVLQQALNEHTQRAARTSHFGAVVDTTRPAPCPVCTQIMRRYVVGDVEVDLCDVDGAFYDVDELPRVRDALLRGAGPSAHELPMAGAVVAVVDPAAARDQRELARLQRSLRDDDLDDDGRARVIAASVRAQQRLHGVDDGTNPLARVVAALLRALF